MMDNIRKDKRFSEILRDPRFRKMPSAKRKTKIDKRFQGMFEDENFKLTYSMDKRGKPWKHTTSEDLKKFYSVSSESEEDKQVEVPEVEKQDKESHSDSDSKSHSDSDPKGHSDSDTELKTSKSVKSKTEGIVEQPVETDSSSSGDDDSSEEDSDSDVLGEPGSEDDADDDEFDHKWDELDAGAPAASDATRRIAVCNMDWDRIRAQDIMAVFNSFKPADGLIEAVKIYPSEFGLKRMEEENLHGPVELISNKGTDSTSNTEKTESSKYHREKLRQYQINRLKYYYAVVECDSVKTANSLYEQLNGMEYESSAVCMDIRFIPDDMAFEQDPKCVAESVPDPSEYKPRLFVTSALQQVKVNLTWDETDPARRETFQKAFREPDAVEKDLRDYIALSSSESEADEADLNLPDNVQGEENKPKKMSMKDRIDAYKSLLKSLEEKEKEEEDSKYDMEITWEPGLKEKTKELVKEKLVQKTPKTPFEEKLQKKKQENKLKKKERKNMSKQEVDEENDSEEVDDDMLTNTGSEKYHSKKSDEAESGRGDACTAEELALMMSDGNDSDAPIDDSQKNKKKWKKKKKQNLPVSKKSDGFEVDVTDNRFSAIYTSHLFNIDPSDSHFKESKGMQSIIQEKRRKRHVVDSDGSSSVATKTRKTYLNEDTSALLDAIKRKTEKFTVK